MTALMMRELQAYYNTMTGYVFTGVCLLVSGILFSANNILGGSASFSSVIGSISYVLILIMPLLTMRLFAEERKNKSDQLLLTAPVSITRIVIGKFLAALSVLAITLAISLIFPLITVIFGDPYGGEIILGYCGIILLGSAFTAIGIFISAISENQLTSAVATMGALLLLWLMDLIIPQIKNTSLNTIAGALSLYRQFERFQLGVLSLSSAVYFVSVTALFLFITAKVVEKRRWSKG